MKKCPVELFGAAKRGLHPSINPINNKDRQMRYELYRECQISAPTTQQIIDKDNRFLKKPLLSLRYQYTTNVAKRQ